MAPAINPAYRIRPLQLGDILDEAFRIYRARFGLLLGTALIASIPGLLVGLGGGANTILGAYMQSTFGANSTVDRAGLDPSLFWLIALGGVVGFLMFPVTSALPSFAASAAALGLPVTAGSLLGFAVRNYFKLWVLAAVNFIMAALSVFILPVYFLVRWSFVYQAFYLERAGVGGSFNRSSTLSLNSWWRIFAIRLLTRFIVGIIGFVLGILFSIPALLLPLGVVRQGTAGLLAALVATVLLPYGALVATLLYLDMRVRLESLDLQLMAGQAGSQPAPDGYSQPPTTPPAWAQPTATPPGTWNQPPPPSPDLPPPSR